MDAVLFDLFGTLIPNVAREDFEEGTLQVASLLDVELERLRTGMRQQFRERMTGEIPDGPRQFVPLAQRLGSTASVDALAEASRAWRTMLSRAFEPKPEALGTLEALTGRGLRLALVTDCSTETKDHFEASAMAPYFSAHAYSAHLGTKKPDPRMYRHVTDALGVDPARCLYVGDGNSHELRGARNLGMRTVWVDNGDDQHVKIDFDNDADHTVQSLDEVLALLPDAGPATA